MEGQSKTDFSCFRCDAPIPLDVMRERMKAPPGKCPECGDVIVAEVREGALARLAAELDLPVGRIDLR